MSITPLDELRELVAYATPDQLAELEQLIAQEVRAIDEADELARIRDQREGRISELEADHGLWLRAMLPGYFRYGFAPHQNDLWRWVWSIRAGERVDPFVAVWARGGTKSTSAEGAVTALGARAARSYVLYVCDTQSRANDHVDSIKSMLESSTIEAAYPDMSEREVTKYGTSRWSATRLRTRSGFTVDAIGLDGAIRGVKNRQQRPDMIVIDDIDRDTDSPGVTQRKIARLTKELFPTGGNEGVAVLAIQNLIHQDSVFAQLADGRADFLRRRHLSGPVPAIRDLVYVDRPEGGYEIRAGEPTWEGQDLEACQSFIDTYGLSAFLSECQHETEPPAGGMWDHVDWAALRVEPDAVPELVRVACWVDPAVTDKDSSDSQAVQVDGLGVDGVVYRLFSHEHRGSPQSVLRLACRKAAELGATRVGVETDQGGDTWHSVFREARDAEAAELEGDAAVSGDAAMADLAAAVRRLGFAEEKAGAGHGPKAARSQRMLADYERPGRPVRHVIGTHLILERALRRFPRTKPFDLADAAFWSHFDLRRGSKAKLPNVDVAQMQIPSGVRSGF